LWGKLKKISVFTLKDGRWEKIDGRREKEKAIGKSH
jgi:hypothetical protein